MTSCLARFDSPYGLPRFITRLEEMVGKDHGQEMPLKSKNEELMWRVLKDQKQQQKMRFASLGSLEFPGLMWFCVNLMSRKNVKR